MTEIRPIPHDPHAEAAVLGATLLDVGAFDAAAELIGEADFHLDEHRLIWRGITAVIAAGDSPDVVSVFSALRAAGCAEEAGGLARLNNLAPGAPSAGSVRRYAGIVREHARRRRAIAAADALAASAADLARPVDDALAECVQALDAVADGAASDADDELLRSAVDSAVTYANERAQAPGQVSGLATGLVDLDALTHGLEPGQLVVVGGRPGQGKSLMGAVISEYVTEQGRSVLVFSMEMPRRDWGLRLVSARARVSISDLRRGTTLPEAWARIVDAQQALRDRRLMIDDRASLNMQQMRARAKRIARRYGLDLIVVDYLQLAAGVGDNRTAQVGSIANGLKALAKELAVPVIALAQLSRNVENRADKRPVLADLRESGDIEAAADVVIALHREAEYSDDPAWQPLLEVRVLKNRAGPKGEVVLRWDAEHGRIDNHAGPNPRGNVRPRRAASFDDAPRRPATKLRCEVD